MNPVIAKWLSRCFFGDRNLDTVSQDPDRPAMQEMLHLLTQTAKEMLRAFKSETYQVNYDVGFQLEDALTEHTRGVPQPSGPQSLAVRGAKRNGLYMVHAGHAKRCHFVPGPDETRHKVRSDVSTSSNE